MPGSQTRICTHRRPTPSQTIPLDLLILADRHKIQLLLIMQPLCLCHLLLLSDGRESSDNGCCSSDSIRLGLRFGLFLLGNSANLIEITSKYCCIWNILGGLGQLKEDDSSTDNKETHYNGYYRGRGTLESPEKDCGGDNRGAREENIVCRSNKSGIKDIQSFLARS